MARSDCRLRSDLRAKAQPVLQGEQFRIRGSLHVLGPPGRDDINKHFPGDRLVNGATFDWEQERLRIFDKLSPSLKATFLHPVPGSPLEDDPKKSEDYPEQLEDDDVENKKLALTRFALLALEPQEID